MGSWRGSNGSGGPPGKKTWPASVSWPVGPERRTRVPSIAIERPIDLCARMGSAPASLAASRATRLATDSGMVMSE
eukprot:8536067-Alexandrium_andersonii.AAC.1